jgi:hypothetical protein
MCMQILACDDDDILKSLVHTWTECYKEGGDKEYCVYNRLLFIYIVQSWVIFSPVPTSSVYLIGTRDS